jgi:hypothetical protein
MIQEIDTLASIWVEFFNDYQFMEVPVRGFTRRDTFL